MSRKHSFDSWPHAIKLLRSRGEEEQRAIIRWMTPLDQLLFDADFEAWAHRAQLPPNDEGWRVWLMMAGRGFGKTRAGAEWIHRLAAQRSGLRIALIGASIDETRRIMVEGVSGLLSIARRQRRRIHWEPSLGRLKWPNGSQAELFSGDHPDGLRGPEHDFAWGAADARLARRPDC
jgi:phage terminase large subunit-like protein